MTRRKAFCTLFTVARVTRSCGAPRASGRAPASNGRHMVPLASNSPRCASSRATSKCSPALARPSFARHRRDQRGPRDARARLRLLSLGRSGGARVRRRPGRALPPHGARRRRFRRASRRARGGRRASPTRPPALDIEGGTFGLRRVGIATDGVLRRSRERKASRYVSVRPRSVGRPSRQPNELPRVLRSLAHRQRHVWRELSAAAQWERRPASFCIRQR